uniref:Uncharacterized protein n=1 Tax=Oryza sativa subsp. japonica TaxID=39947 RepID=H2KW35_ORYSJ|nr:hypothetical protein LOC_Os11g45899 [Oryza sativa Japonica Group]
MGTCCLGCLPVKGLSKDVQGTIHLIPRVDRFIGSFTTSCFAKMKFFAQGPICKKVNDNRIDEEGGIEAWSSLYPVTVVRKKLGKLSSDERKEVVDTSLLVTKGDMKDLLENLMKMGMIGPRNVVGVSEMKLELMPNELRRVVKSLLIRRVKHGGRGIQQIPLWMIEAIQNVVVVWKTLSNMYSGEGNVMMMVEA